MMNRPPVIIVFSEPDFPAADSTPVSRESLAAALAGLGEVHWVGADALLSALENHAALLITPYGSAFPKMAWTALLAFLKRGGHWLNLGGAPVTRPVRREGGVWRLEALQNVYGKVLMIRQTFEVAIPADSVLVASRQATELAGVAEIANNLHASPVARAWALQVMLTNKSKLIPCDPGSDGPRDAILHSLVEARSADGRNLVSPIVALEHINGAFAGGRWVLASFDGQAQWTPTLLNALVRQALTPVVQLETKSDFACYTPGENPAITVHAASRVEMTLDLNLTVTCTADGVVVSSLRQTFRLGATEDACLNAAPLAGLRPGLYRIDVSAEFAGAVVAIAENGFWVEAVGEMAAPAPLVANGDYFTRKGTPYPVTGTTYMSTVVHRSWMFEPTPVAWERDFAAMKAAGVNLVRTGLWMGWKRAMAVPGAMDEGVIRALRAFLLAAARHDLPVIMTLFAFLPESWGGTHPYLDPVAVRAQCAFASALACGVSDAPHLLWDLINEPSISTPQRLWSCRPTYDPCEAAAWRLWLSAQGLRDDEWRARWRLTPADTLDLPGVEDFTDHHVYGDVQPLRCMDFVRFSQDVFTQWAARLTATLRACATPSQLVTVGQDEAGAGTSPSTHFHGPAVDFTSNHSWWANDDLLWDAVVTKLQGKPHLMEETGIMFAETADGLPLRSPEFVAGILERKLAMAFTCGGAGVIQWLWNTDIYLYSDNEAAIGLLRADGSEKEELSAFRQVAAFMSRNASRLTGRNPEHVAVLIPHSNLFSVRETAQTATRRSVRTLEYRLGLPCRGVSEYAPEALGDAKLIVLPAPCILKEKSWEVVLERVKAGATLLISGHAEADEYWQETARLAAFGVSQKTAPIMHEEHLILDWSGAPVTTLRMAMTVLVGGIQKIGKAVAPDGSALIGRALPCGKGRILFSPVPVEHAMAEEDTEAVYRLAATCAGLTCGKRPGLVDGGPGLLVRPVELADSTLFILVNESSLEQTANLRGTLPGAGSAWEIPVTVPSNRAVLAIVDSRTGRLLDDSKHL